MKRKIKRTEITIETVEITIIRRAGPERAHAESTPDETRVMDLSLARSTGPIALAAPSDERNKIEEEQL
jgi:hypothetical protein